MSDLDCYHFRALEDYLHSRGRSERRSWPEKVLALPGLAAHSRDRLRVLGMLGAIATIQSDFAAARSALDEALSLARELGDAEGEHQALNFLGEAAHYSGDLDRAEAFCEEALAVSRRSALPLAEDLHNLGAIRFGRGDLEGAAVQLEEALRLANYVPTQLMLGELEQRRGNHERAGALIVAAYERSRSSRSIWGAVAPLTLAWWYVEAKDTARAAPLVHSGLRRADELNLKLEIHHGVEISAAIAALRGDPTSAAELQGAADALATSSNIALGEWRAQTRLRTQPLIDVALGKEASAAAYERGLLLSAPAALDRALAVVAS